MKEIVLSRGMTAFVDDEDYESLSSHNWCIKSSKADYTFYAKTRMKLRDGSIKYPTMHQFIMGKRRGYQIDHINRNGLDNRRSNLRFATNRTQVLNRRKVKNSSSNYKGISRRKDTGKWVAYVSIGHHTTMHLGSYVTEVEAYQVRQKYLTERGL